MELDDERRKLEQEIASEAAKNSLAGSRNMSDRTHIDSDIENLQKEIEREEEFKSDVAQGVEALAEKNFQRAKTFFERAEMLKPGAPEARDGLIQSLLLAGQASEERKFIWKIFGLLESSDYYQALLKLDPTNTNASVRLNAVKRSLLIARMFGIFLGIVLVFLCGLLAFASLKSNDLFYWSEKVCQNPLFGKELCTPVPPPTATPTCTPTFTPTPTLTPSPTITLTPTLTPTITPTPVYVRVWVNRNEVPFYSNGTGPQRNGPTANIGTAFYICSPLSSEGRVLLSPGLCHETTSAGWVVVKYLDFSPVLTP
jgi:hypothetical protein